MTNTKNQVSKCYTQSTSIILWFSCTKHDSQLYVICTCLNGRDKKRKGDVWNLHLLPNRFYLFCQFGTNSYLWYNHLSIAFFCHNKIWGRRWCRARKKRMFTSMRKTPCQIISSYTIVFQNKFHFSDHYYRWNWRNKIFIYVRVFLSAEFYREFQVKWKKAAGFHCHLHFKRLFSVTLLDLHKNQ